MPAERSPHVRATTGSWWPHENETRAALLPGILATESSCDEGEGGATLFSAARGTIAPLNAPWSGCHLAPSLLWASDDGHVGASEELSP